MGAKIAIGGARSARFWGCWVIGNMHGCGLLGLTVRPLWPPTTGTTTSLEMAGFPRISATKVEARTTSRVVTPKILLDGGLDTWDRAVVIGHAPLGIKDTVFLEDFDDDGNCGVDWVGNDENECLWGRGCNAGRKIPDDTTVNL
jgi:hypothetical protein